LNSRLVTVLASSVLPTPVGPARKATPRGLPPWRLAPTPVTARLMMSIMCTTAWSWPFNLSLLKRSPSRILDRGIFSHGSSVTPTL